MEKPGRRKVRQGVVVSNKMMKTVVVEVTRFIQHPKYNKTIKRSKKFKAHDEENKCSIGDIVEIWETRPLSKEKRWRVVKILKKAQLTEQEGEGDDTTTDKT
jgi:small subunit ribosomal protein S17